MLRIAVIQPGATDLDQQGRIKGSLDLPLCIAGEEQVARLVQELSAEPFDAVYVGPGQSAMQTAKAIARTHKLKAKLVKKLSNWDHGLWHGKLIDEVKQTQPNLSRQGQTNPESICPPNGESINDAQQRVSSALNRIVKRHKQGTLGVVISEPLASLVRSYLEEGTMESFWEAECDSGRWSLIELDRVPVSG